MTIKRKIKKEFFTLQIMHALFLELQLKILVVVWKVMLTLEMIVIRNYRQDEIRGITIRILNNRVEEITIRMVKIILLMVLLEMKLSRNKKSK